MEKPSLYVQLAEDIKSYIPAHALAPGDRLPSIQELCQMFKVSHATVRAALNLLTQEGVVESRPRLGLFVGQVREGRAAEPRDKVIALLLSGQESAYEAGIIRGVMEHSLKAGYQVIVASNGSDVAVEAQQLEELMGQVSGLIVFPTHASGNYASYAKMLEMGTPWVFVDRGVTGLSASLVATDNRLGGYLGARHLLECGYREIYAISAKPVSSIQERIQGVRRALKEWGLSSTTNIRSSTEYESSVGYTFTKQILSERVGEERIALFLLDETLVLPCYAALKEAKLRIPDDVAVISYDDISARYFDPPLSSVRQDPHGMGVEATRILLEQIRSGNAGPREIRLQPELVVRNSTDVKLAVNWADYQVLMDEGRPAGALPATVSF